MNFNANGKAKQFGVHPTAQLKYTCTRFHRQGIAAFKAFGPIILLTILTPFLLKRQSSFTARILREKNKVPFKNLIESAFCLLMQHLVREIACNSMDGRPSS